MKQKTSTNVDFLLSLPRSAKIGVVLCVDTSLIILSVWLAYYLRLGEFISLSNEALISLTTSIVFALPIFIISGLYRTIFRYSGWPALLTVARAIFIYGLLYVYIHCYRYCRCTTHHRHNSANIATLICWSF